MRRGIGEDPGWDVPARIWITNMPKCGEELQAKKRMRVTNARSKTVALAVKWKAQKI